MKIALTLLALVAVAQARHFQFDLEDNTAYNYLAKYGLPLAEKIRAAEETGSQSKIVGGSLATLGQFPYQAGLLSTFAAGRGVCGASLISQDRLLTAAHCWYDGVNQASSIEVVLGSLTLFSGGVRQETRNIAVHSAWNPSLIRNDVAIIILPSPVALSALIQPISMATGSDSFAGLTAVASGFGLTADGGSISTQQRLSFVNLEVITNTLCSWSFPFSIQSSNICTSGNGGTSTCSGDSGGPLAIDNHGQPLLIGVVSFGSALGCERGFPAAFARVSSFTDFINQNM